MTRSPILPSVGNRAPGGWTSGASRQRFSVGERERKAAVKRDARGGQLAAIVLAGGQSRRFAPDKLAELVGGQTLLDLTLSAIPTDFSVVLVGPPRPTVRPVELVREQPPGGGPAAALVTGLRHALSRSAEVLLVLPGDAPRAGAGARVLLERLTADPATEAVVAVDDSGQVQPLQLALRPSAASALVELAGPRQGAGESARALLAQLQPSAVTCRLPAEQLFDVDTAEALQRLATPPSRFASPDG